MTQIKIPDIGDFDEVEVIEVLVGAGDSIAIEEPVITLESDKATMEIPSPVNGTVNSISVAVGDRVREGTLIAEIAEAMDPEEQERQAPRTDDEPAGKVTEDQRAMDSHPHRNDEDDDQGPRQKTSEAPDHAPVDAGESTKKEHPVVTEATPGSSHLPPHASPGIRRFARELGADLSRINGSGRKGRIVREDVKNWVKRQLAESRPMDQQMGQPSGAGIPPVPQIDFSLFGEIETVSLSRIKKLSGPHLQRAWLNIPHVTHHDEADITELEEFRQSLKGEAEKKGLRITLLPFAIKALTRALKEYPDFNASLAPDGERLILKHYFNVGIAVDTPDGLVVPVIRDADRKSIFELARELAELGERARNNRLGADELKGGCISISSLGGIGGTAFTPIVNAPEVAILGISRATTTPVWDGQEFVPRLLLPLSLSYDHRAVDGAQATRFVSCLGRLLADIRRLSL